MFNKNIEALDIEKKIVENDFISKRKLTFDSENTFNWLLSDWSSDVWELDGPNGSKENTVKIYWRQILPNGEFLTDSANHRILEKCKRLITTIRHGHDASVKNSEGQRHSFLYLISIIRWMCLCNLGSHPYQELSFKVLTRDDFQSFLGLLSTGSDGVEKKVARVSACLAENQFGKTNSLMLKSGFIDRARLAELLNVDRSSLKSPRVEAVIREYEPEIRYPDFRVPQNSKRREHITNRQELFTDEANSLASETVIRDYLNIWKLLYFHNDQIQGLLSFDPFNFSCPTKVLNSISHKKKGRTPNIPIDIALTYLDHSIRWVIDYGEDLIGVWKHCELEWARIRKNENTRRDHYAKRVFDSVNLPASLKPLQLKRYNVNQTAVTISGIRSNLSIEEAMECLYAACFIVIATFTARRKEEIMTLTVDCVEKQYDGYVLDFNAEKISFSNRPVKLQRPIPDLVFHAVRIIKSIQQDHSDRSLDSENSQLLFSIEKGGRLVKPSAWYICKKLDFFADIVEIPTFTKQEETQPRRWYLRPHELRRFFAYTFFWSSPDSNLETLSWFLGHLNAEDSEHYITNIIAGSEIPKNLRSLVIAGIQDEATKGHRMALKKLIENKFNGKPIELIPEEFLEQYITELVASKKVRADVINSPTQYSGKAICIYIEGAENEQINI